MTRINKYLKAIVCTSCMAVMSNVSAQTWPPLGMNGNGTSGDPWQITTFAHLEELADFVNAGNGSQTARKYYKLMNDIDLIDYSYGEGWEPIGHLRGGGGLTAYQFHGNFDGNNKVIQNLTINRGTYRGGLGLFGHIRYATIHDIGIENCDIYGSNIGALVGNSYFSFLKNCYSTGYVTGAGLFTLEDVGGLVGNLRYSSTLENCYSYCNVSGQRYRIGGLVGEATFDSYINNCYATGDVSGIGNSSPEIGGLVGYSGDLITNCYATGNVKGVNYGIGGLVGVHHGIISYCYAKGAVKGAQGTYYVGGLTGWCNSGYLRNCVAINDYVIVEGGSTNGVNRIAGGITNNYILSNNYAYDGMAIQPQGGNAGISTPMATLMSFNFYNTGSNWYNNIPWDIDEVDNPAVIWGICDTETLPFFQWQGFNCSNKTPHTGNQEEEYYSTIQNVESSFSIFPNPTFNHITISSKEDFHTIEVIDLFGRVVHSQINQGNTTTLNVSNYSSGIYFVRIISKEGASIQKFVKN